MDGRPLSSPYLYFASGCNRVPDMLGMADAGHAVGVSVPKLSPAAVHHLCRLEVPVFLDTGAFSEVEERGGMLAVVSPIDDDEWERRLGVMMRVARALGPRCMAVAPDRIGCQQETLERMRQFAPAVRQIAATGARLIVALQRGPCEPGQYLRRCSDALGIPTHGLVAGVPSNKAPMALDVFAALLEDARPHAVHLLGMGPRNSRFAARLALCRRLVPDIEVSCDSNAIAAVVGRGQRGTTPRHLTTAMDEETAKARDLAFADYEGIDYTEDLCRPSAWLTGAHLIAFRAAVMGIGMVVCDDIDDWVRDHWENAWVGELLDNAWLAWFMDVGSRQARRRLAVARTFSDREPEPCTTVPTQLSLGL